MSIYEYDEERELALIRRDEREIGMEQGMEQGKALGEKIGRQEEREKTVQAIIAVCQELGGSREETMEKLMEKCNLTKMQAQKKIEQYWKKNL